MNEHKISYRVYYEDTDAGGIMYHGNFINFCERARTEYINDRGATNREIWEKGTGMVVRHLDADYLSPAYLEDMLEVVTCVEAVQNSSFIMKQTIYRDETILFDMKVVLVCVNHQGRAVRIPDFVKELLEEK
jgi:acyl-CoA thioester hydrolase